MLLIPGSIPTDVYLVDRDMFNLSATAVDRNSEPTYAVRRLDPITVTPASFVILDVIVKDEDIRFLHLVKIAPPRDIRRLKDYTTGHM
jgi:hypothetical protein